MIVYLLQVLKFMCIHRRFGVVWMAVETKNIIADKSVELKLKFFGWTQTQQHAITRKKK